jgi:hypothetical protein
MRLRRTHFLVQINIIKLWIRINSHFKGFLTHVDYGVGNVTNNNVCSYIKCFIGKPIFGWYHLEPRQQNSREGGTNLI